MGALHIHAGVTAFGNLNQVVYVQLLKNVLKKIFLEKGFVFKIRIPQFFTKHTCTMYTGMARNIQRSKCVILGSASILKLTIFSHTFVLMI